MEKPPSLARLQSLEAVVRTGSFSRAAEQLLLTQPAVSLHVRQLEQDYGVALVERIGKTAVATAEGRRLLDHAGRAMAELSAAARALQSRRGRIVGPLRIGAGATAMIHLLPDRLRRLTRAHPDIELGVVDGNTPDLVAQLVANELDIAVVTAPVANRALARSPFFTDALVAAVPPGAAAPDGGFAPADLGPRPLVLYERGGLIRQVIDGWFAAAGVAPARVLDISDAEALKRMVMAGLGTGITSRISIRAEAAAGVLRAVPLVPPLERRLIVVWRRDRAANPAIATARAALRPAASPPDDNAAATSAGDDHRGNS